MVLWLLCLTWIILGPAGGYYKRGEEQFTFQWEDHHHCYYILYKMYYIGMKYNILLYHWLIVINESESPASDYSVCSAHCTAPLLRLIWFSQIICFLSWSIHAWPVQIVITKLRQRIALDHDRRNLKAAKVFRNCTLWVETWRMILRPCLRNINARRI